jgi:Ca2+/Na+ antiporter
MVSALVSQEKPMILSLSAVILLGVIAFLFFRKDGMKVSHAVVCSLFGFYLAGTAIAPSIKAGGQSLASLLGGLKL